MGWGPFQFPVGPAEASKDAFGYDLLFGVITALTVLFTVIVFGMVLFLAIRYRRGTKVDRSNPIHHHTGLELTWSIIPTILGLIIFVWSAYNFVQVRTMPKDATEIFVIGKQWMWHFEHMDGTRENNELHVPVGKPIKLTMISQDVIHAMYLPEMRAQYHVVPGRYTDLQFTPTVPGEYHILCAMHCGTGHSEMVGKLVVMDQREYAAWADQGGNRFQNKSLTMVEAGRKVWNDKGCGNCHTGVDNQRAPTLLGVVGSTRHFTDGGTAKADNDYLRESILEPWKRVTAGYENTMQAYQGQLTELEVLDLIQYIGSLTGSPSKGNDGKIVPYERPQRQTAPMAGERKTEVDVANGTSSAGRSQFKTTEDMR